jgi:AcrR family transcriptional regulator
MERTRRGYHHGDLPAAALAEVDRIVQERGVAAVSLREVARRVGVSNAAPSHHFGDKAGLLTAYATQGFELLAAHLSEASGREDLLSLGQAYVAFATERPGHFAVMFRPELLHGDDPHLLAAGAGAFGALAAAIASVRGMQPHDDVVQFAAAGAWSLVHGFATLWLAGNFAAPVTTMPEADAVRRSIEELVATILEATT